MLHRKSLRANLLFTSVQTSRNHHPDIKVQMTAGAKEEVGAVTEPDLRTSRVTAEAENISDSAFFKIGHKMRGVLFGLAAVLSNCCETS